MGLPRFRELDVQSLLMIADEGIVSEAAAEELRSLNAKLQVEMITEENNYI